MLACPFLRSRRRWPLRTILVLTMSQRRPKPPIRLNMWAWGKKPRSHIELLGRWDWNFNLTSLQATTTSKAWASWSKLIHNDHPRHINTYQVLCPTCIHHRPSGPSDPFLKATLHSAVAEIKETLQGLKEEIQELKAAAGQKVAKGLVFPKTKCHAMLAMRTQGPWQDIVTSCHIHHLLPLFTGRWLVLLLGQSLSGSQFLPALKLKGPSWHMGLSQAISIFVNRALKISVILLYITVRYGCI